MESPLSPIVRRIAGEVAKSPPPRFPRSSKIYLEEWWLEIPEDGKGFAVGGRPLEPRKSRNAQQKRCSPPSQRRYALREFHSKVIRKTHGCTTLETSDGFTVSLCGLINTFRSKENGFSSEVCRDFIIGFPFNWNDYAASTGEESSQGGFCLRGEPSEWLPADLDDCSGAQLHNLVFSLSDNERELLNQKVYDDLIGMLDPQPTDEESLTLKTCSTSSCALALFGN